MTRMESANTGSLVRRLLGGIAVGAALAAAMTMTADVSAQGKAKGKSKVQICHNPGGHERTLTVPAQVVGWHLSHGDYAGACGAGDDSGGGDAGGSNPLD